MFFGISGFMIIAFFSYPRERIVLSVFISILFAVTISLYHKLHPLKKTTFDVKSKHFFITSIFLLVFSHVILISRFNGELHLKKALVARSSGESDVIIKEVNQAKSFFYSLDPTAAPIVWYSGVAKFQMNKIEEALRDFQLAYSLHPNHIFVINNYATCSELLGDHDNAINLYKHTLEIAPHLEEALVNLSLVYSGLKQYKNAYETITKCNQDILSQELKDYMQSLEGKENETLN